MKWLELRYIILDHAFEVYAGSIALLFTILGIWIATRLTRPQHTAAEPPPANRVSAPNELPDQDQNSVQDRQTFQDRQISQDRQLSPHRSQDRQVSRQSSPNEDFVPDEKEQLRLGLSQRELEVLQLMSEGLSNQEIAERLYLSLNTIKTHSSRLFFKLDVNRRTQAIDKAKKLNLIR